MKKLVVVAIVLSVFILTSFKPVVNKFASKDTFVSFFYQAEKEGITANNHKVISTIDTETGEIAIYVSMKNFEIENKMTLEHFNSDKFFDTQKYPNAKFTFKISNFKSVDFSKDGIYDINIKGELTIKESSKRLNEKAIIRIVDGIVTFESKMNLSLSNYGVNFAEEMKVSIIARYSAI